MHRALAVRRRNGRQDVDHGPEGDRHLGDLDGTGAGLGAGMRDRRAPTLHTERKP